MSRPTRPFSRRSFLQIAGAGAGLMALESAWGPAIARAEEESPKLLLCVYFEGGWDQLLALDPRDGTQAKFNQATGGKINCAFDTIPAGTEPGDFLKATPSGVRKAGALSFGAAVPQKLVSFAADLAIVRGLFMETLTHEVGRYYFLTGKLPRGLAPNGNSLGTMVAALQAAGTASLPNLMVGAQGFNEDQPAHASPIRVNNNADLAKVLRPLGTLLSPDSDAALKAYEGREPGCDHEELDGGGLASLFRTSRARARTMIASPQADLFQYSFTAKPPGGQALFDRYGIANATDLAGPKGRALVAGLALEHHVANAVSVTVTESLDDHDDWANEHPEKLSVGFQALTGLINHLKNTEFKGPGGGSVWDRTTLVAFSEFARTPDLNARAGRDHHLASSCLVGGPGIRGGVVVGGTDDVNMAARRVDPDTFEVDATGKDPDAVGLRPSDVHATLLHSMGLSTDHLANQSPRLVTKLLKP